MIKKTVFIIYALGLLLYFNSCNQTASGDNKTISADTATIARGEAIFNQSCSGCHNFRQDGIGPQLGGLTTEVSPEWMKHFIQNPKEVINSGDAHATQLYKKYKVVMPSFTTLSDDQLNGIISFIHVQKVTGEKVKKKSGLLNPIRDTIKSSGVTVALKLVTQVPASSDSGKLPLARITKLDFQPNTRASFILDLRGKLYKLQNNVPSVYMDISKLEPKFIDQPGLATGFGSFAFHPDFATNGLLYTTHTEPPGSARADFGYADSIKVNLQWVLTEWKASNPAAPVFSGKGRELLRVNMVANIHGVQEIAFNPLAKPGSKEYGLLYIGVGDGGCVENGYSFLAHSAEKVWGTILRINPAGRNSVNGHYGIPSQNPFVKYKNQKALGEVYAYGFRNPHRITWSKSGQMLVCNIGHGNIESINLVTKSHDYGWPMREGTFVVHPGEELNDVFPLPENDNIYHITYPVAQYDHDEGKAISGGYEYQGKAIPMLKGKYIFGDIPTGRLFYTNMADLKQGRQAAIKEWNIAINDTVKTFSQMCKGERVDLHFGRDAAGELYILTKADGKVYKLVSATKQD